MASTQSAAPAAVATGGWTSFFDLDTTGFRGLGKDEIRLFARDVHKALPKAPPSDVKRRRLIDKARIAKPRSATDYALVALHDSLPILLDLLRGWSSREVAQVFSALRTRWAQMCDDERFDLDLDDVADWVLAHTGDDRATAMTACIEVDAPVEVRITRRLAQAGSQKVVFEAEWIVADDPTEIVLKRFLEGMQTIFERELRPHPLSMRHPNIIETYWLANQARPPELFLVERRLDPLRNTRLLSGESEGARLFVDLMRALTFLDDQGLVHGDIKPDNVAYSEGRFILLDFGVCRPAPDFKRADATATGSLRTRAPELLLDGEHSSKSDVWAAGATVFNMIVGRFPLWRPKDPPLPSLQDDRDGKRRKAEDRLRKRVKRSYERNLVEVREFSNRRFRSLLEASLDKDPERRPDARTLLADALKELPSLIGSQDGPLFEAKTEIIEMGRYLTRRPDELALMSERERGDLRARLETLRRELKAQRHYQRKAAELKAKVQRSLLVTPVAAKTAAAVEAAVSEVSEYLSRDDQKIDDEWEALVERLEAPKGAQTAAAPPSTDLAETLHRLAVSSVGMRDDVSKAVQELTALIAPGG